MQKITLREISFMNYKSIAGGFKNNLTVESFDDYYPVPPVGYIVPPYIEPKNYDKEPLKYIIG